MYSITINIPAWFAWALVIFYGIAAYPNLRQLVIDVINLFK